MFFQANLDLFVIVFKWKFIFQGKSKSDICRLDALRLNTERLKILIVVDV